MDVQSILALASVKAIINFMEQQYHDTYSHEDCYDELEEENLCQVCYAGETKTVLLNKDWDFVIKIPNYANYHTNHCELEVINYQKAKAYRIEPLLLETAKLCTLHNGIQLYVQLRYSCSNCDFMRQFTIIELRKKMQKSVNYKMIERIKNTTYQGYRIDSFWLMRALQLYGKRFFQSFEKWTQDNQVGDLHNNNLCWIKNRPYIMDYSGYFEE